MFRNSEKITKKNNLKTRTGHLYASRSPGLFSSAQTASASDTVLLYQIVFKSKQAGLLVLLLCLCFATQTVKFAQASEESPSATVAPAPVQTEPAAPETENTQQKTTETDNSATDMVTTSPAGKDSDEPSVNESDSLVEKQSESAQPETSESVATTTVIDAAASSSDPVATSTDTTATATDTHPTSSIASTTDAHSISSAASTTDAVTDTGSSTSTADDSTSSSSTSSSVTTSQSATSSATSSTAAADADQQSTDATDPADSSAAATSTQQTENEPANTEEPKLSFTIESDSHLSFDRNQCTRVEDGTFYCQKPKSNVQLEDSLTAAPDSEGDLEIFLVRNGERQQITNNQVDDAAPYYDEVSNTIVWHRLLNDRYQIITYDIETGEEQQLTQTTVNNMQPTRQGDNIVWQRWVEDNWEIILYDGTEYTQITDSPRHDIAPHIRGPLIIWNSQSNDGSQELQTYDIRTGAKTTITDDEGAAVSNPRMVVMYEALYENGDIVTKGFDLLSGKVVPLQALPKKLPDDLPDPEPTEEVRALIQNKPEPKASSTPNITPATGNGTTSTSTNATSTSSTSTDQSDTLDLRTLSTAKLVEYLNDTDIATATVPDLVIEPDTDPAESRTTASATQHIPDVVVPPTDDVSTSSQVHTNN